MANRRDTRDDVLLSWSVPALLQEPRHTTLTYAALAFWASFFSNFFLLLLALTQPPVNVVSFVVPFLVSGQRPLSGFHTISFVVPRVLPLVASLSSYRASSER